MGMTADVYAVGIDLENHISPALTGGVILCSGISDQHFRSKLSSL